MKSRLYLIIIIAVCFLTSGSVKAQDNSVRQIYSQAESDYETGRVEQALSTLQANIAIFKGNLQQSAYRLMALCLLSLDENEKAEDCTRRLLDYDPYFTPSSQDPQRFIDMVENIKLGLTAKITTASSQAESLDEVPVPTTLITEEMIHNCGGMNLQEVLAAYVPGMNIVDCNDDINIAMRGIYSNGQEKILFMLNGHRLNNYSTNIAAPDYSISLEKVKQIEVLRGPASSLYGGVALTAVVNIITKQGADVNGVMIKGGIGNYHQLRGDLLFGKRYFDLDLLIWGSIYGNKGQTMDAPPEMAGDEYGIPFPTVSINHIGEKPSFDFGVQMKYKNLQFLYNTHFSQKIPPYSMSTIAKSYDHDKYMLLNGFSPSFSSKSHHADLSYSRSLGKVNLKGTVTYDNSELSHYQIVTDFPFPELGSYYGIPDSLNFFNYPGLFRFLSADEKNYGVTLKGDYSYIESKNHKGSISFGAEWSQFSVDNVRYALGYNFTTLNRENSFITESGKGRENSYNGFLQLKHQWGPVILNAGLRYDHKERADNEVLREYSPRVAFIFLQPKWNIKLSYSRSFVDAPYMYRKINELLPILVGNVSSKRDLVFTSLDPEFVNSVQITFAGINWIKGLSFELNGFYNVAKNLIETHVISHENKGTNKMGGLEFQAQYRSKRFTGDFNLTWTHTFKSNVFTEDIDDNNNIPTIMSNAVLAWQVTPRLKLHSHIMFEGVQRTYNLDVVEMLRFLKFAENVTEEHIIDPAFWDQYKLLASKLIMNKRIPSRVIFNLGAEYKIDKFTFGINVHNLFDKYYYRSGMNTNIVPQRGRWFMFDIAYKI